MIEYTKRMMKYITVLLLAVFLIPLVQNVNAQSILGPTSGGLGGGIKNLPSSAEQSLNGTSQQAGQSASNATQSLNGTSQQAGQSASNATSQNNTSSGNPIMDMLGKIIPGK
jgi:hypothetical protein